MSKQLYYCHCSSGDKSSTVDQSSVFNGATLLVEQAEDEEDDDLTYTCVVDNTWNPLHCVVGSYFCKYQNRYMRKNGDTFINKHDPLK